MGKILGLWVRTNVLPEDTSSLGINRELPVVYVLADRSYADALVLDSITKNKNLPKLYKKLSLSKSGRIFPFFSSSNDNHKKTKKYRPKNLIKLVSALQEGHIQEVQIVPVYVRWGRAPTREKSWLKALFTDAWVNPTYLRKFLIILLHGKQTFINFSPLIHVNKELLGDLTPEAAATKVIRLARIHFYQQKVAMIGPDLSHRRTLIEKLVKRPSIQKLIGERATRKNITVKQAREKAYEYANEIASDYNYPTIRFYDAVLTRVWNSIYSGVDVQKQEAVQALAGSHEIIYVPCHRSHIDYLLLSFVLYYNALATPYIAAGINLNMPVIGPILRRGGAFFMRRSFKGNPLYANVFSEYLTMVIEKGHPIEYFIEGGRSRTGRLLPAKLGMLSMTLQAAAKSDKPIAFVPVYFGYEKVMEIGSYIGELYGKKKQKETLGGTLSAVGRLKDDFGKVHVRFGQPIILQQFMDGHITDWKSAMQDQTSDNSTWSKPVIADLGNEILSRINGAADVNSINLLALAILSSNNLTIDQQKLQRQLNVFRNLVSQSGFDNITVTDFSNEQIIKNGIDLKAITTQNHILGDLIQVEQAQALMLTYFKNNSLHIIALPSLLACIFSNNNIISIKECKSLCLWVYDLIQAELFLPWSKEQLDQEMNQQIELMVGLGLIQYQGDDLKAAPVNTAEFEQLSNLSSLIQDSLQRYYIVIAILSHQGSGVLFEAELERLAQMVAQRLTILHSINAPDFYDKAVIRTFLHTLKNKGLMTFNEKGKICFELPFDTVNDNADRLLKSDMLEQISRLTNTENDTLLEYVREEIDTKTEKKRLAKLKPSTKK